MNAGGAPRPDVVHRSALHEVATGERRVPALDGLRGLMTIAVVLSHYFGELPHGHSCVHRRLDCGRHVLRGYLSVT